MSEETTTSIIQSSVEQVQNVLEPFYIQLFKYVVVLALIGFLFLFVKFLITRAINKHKNNSNSNIKNESKDQTYYLEPEQLEVIRLFDKLADEDKARIKNEMYIAVKNKKLKI